MKETIVTKMCPRCYCLVSIHEFMRGPTKSDGMHTLCRMCRGSFSFYEKI
ncbi:MAG: hypothetical protein KKG04_08090 [Candidatus Thermoplasmatota archaeon]|nr:hypothetical protein [Candidatus Thermoplasmatota archaeon]